MIAIFLSSILSLGLSGCSLLGFNSKRPPEVVPSCFSDGENQELYCKSQRTNDLGKIVVTRCIGTQNKEAKPALRGKCVEKICSEGSNTDCVVKGEFAVLEQYAELVTSRLFVEDEAPEPKANKKTEEAMADTGATPEKAPEKAPEEETSKSGQAPAKKGSNKQASAKEELRKEAEAESSSMSLTLKPLKPKKKSRSIASVAGDENGYKKVCVSKRNKGAPEHFRGKCAIRNCVAGKCTYKGRKEMFDWVARHENKEE